MTYSFTVTNTGSIAATNVTFTDPLPASVVLVSTAVTQGIVTQGGGTTVTASLGTLAANGGTATVTIVVKTTTASIPIVANSASASSGGNDLVSATVVTTVQGTADLGIVL